MVGGLGVGIGTYLAFVATPARKPGVAARGVTPWIGVGHVGLSGQFN